MVKTKILLDYLEDLLKPKLFSDYCPNGLQVEGKKEIQSFVSGVTACQALLDEAVKLNADMVLVHHGYFWQVEDPCVVGIKQKRLTTLLTHQINLIAYHLPLDAHPIYGNNKKLADRLNLDFVEDQKNDQSLLCVGRLKTKMTGKSFANAIEKKLNRIPLYIPGNSTEISSIAWCTGGAQDYILEAVEEGVEAFLTGEASERTVHFARENGIHFFAAGHHATERYGVQALGEHLAEKFNLKHRFVDIDNPV